MTNVSNFEEAGLVPYPQHDVDGYRRAGVWRDRALPMDLADVAAEHDASLALITPEIRWTYGELFDHARRFGAGLERVAGVRSGDPIMFQMGNVAETVVAYLGCLFAGVRPVCTLPLHGTREIGLLAEHVGARATIVQADFHRGSPREVAQSVVDEGRLDTIILARGDGRTDPSRATISFDSVSEAGDADALEPVDHEQIAVYQLSGGTTGLPKVAPRLHEEYSYNARVWAEACGWTTSTRLLYPLPIMHNAGIALALQPILLTGGTIVLAPDARVDTILDLLAAERPTSLPLVPPALAVRLLDDERSATMDWSGVTDFFVGGQFLPLDVAERLRDELGIQVRQMFGMAEGMFLLVPEGADEATRFGTVGAPVSPLDEVRILAVGGEEEVAPGTLGEFCARGPYTIRGYFRAEAHNESSFTSDGFYRTGDLARSHEVGGDLVYSIEGRIKDVINRGAEKIHAEEVEDVILHHPDVLDAAVVAMPDPILGERACAFVVMRAGGVSLDVSTLRDFLLEQGLARYKCPERVEEIDELPLSNVGKVSKKTLREWAAEPSEVDKIA